MSSVVELKAVDIGNQGEVNSSVNKIILFAKVDGLEKKMNSVIETLKNVASNLINLRKKVN